MELAGCEFDVLYVVVQGGVEEGGVAQDVQEGQDVLISEGLDVLEHHDLHHLEHLLLLYLQEKSLVLEHQPTDRFKDRAVAMVQVERTPSCFSSAIITDIDNESRKVGQDPLINLYFEPGQS